jgi:hypothetical protein
MTHRIGAEVHERVAQVWPELLATVAAGSTVKDAAADFGLTPGALWAFRFGQDALMREYWDAHKERTAALLDEHLETLRNTDLDSRHARAKLNALQWHIERSDPDRFSPQVKGSLTIKTLDLGPILARAEARLAAQRVIEGEVLRPALGAPQQSADSELELAKSLF